MNLFNLGFITLFFMLLADNIYPQHTASNLVKAELLAEVSTIQPGTPFWVAVRLQMAEHWHIYWSNPGDAGLPPKIKWQLPDGFSAGEIQWPFPQRILEGELAIYGYENEVFLLSKVTPAANFKAGEVFSLEVEIDFLVCKELCLPGRVTATLRLESDSDPQPIKFSRSELFESIRAKLPLRDSGWNISALNEDSVLVFLIRPPRQLSEKLTDMTFFPQKAGIFEHSGEQILRNRAGQYELRVPFARMRPVYPERISGILVTESGWRGPQSEKSLLVDVALE